MSTTPVHSSLDRLKLTIETYKDRHPLELYRALTGISDPNAEEQKFLTAYNSNNAYNSTDIPGGDKADIYAEAKTCLEQIETGMGTGRRGPSAALNRVRGIIETNKDNPILVLYRALTGIPDPTPAEKEFLKLYNPDNKYTPGNQSYEKAVKYLEKVNNTLPDTPAPVANPPEASKYLVENADIDNKIQALGRYINSRRDEVTKQKGKLEFTSDQLKKNNKN